MDQQLDYSILRTIRSSRQPMGSWSIYYLLRERGVKVSAPTIGRRLRDLEHMKMLEKISVDGRVITPAGEKFLRRLSRDWEKRARANELLQVLDGKSQKDVLDQLTVRRIIEAESAGLAAVHAPKDLIPKLNTLIRKQKESIKRGELGIKEDVSFHETLAKASGNQVIFLTVRLLRSQEWMNYIVTAIRAKVGSSLVVDHGEIVVALKGRDATLARRAMERHIDRLVHDVEQYWKLFREAVATDTSIVHAPRAQ
jgi:GntR family transcriptional repressor for pyruvate dehydrogenase complex